MSEFNSHPSISVTANFIKGQMADNIQNLTAGNIQFRKYDYYGYPYAFCPGIRCIRRMYNENSTN